MSTYSRQAKINHLDIDKSEIDKNVKTDVAVVADCKVSLPAITRLLHKNSHKEWIESFKPLYETEYEKVISPAIHPADGPLLMGEVVNVVSEATGGEAILVNDVGLNQMFSCRYFRAYRIDVHSSIALRCDGRSFHHILCVNGCGIIRCGGEAYPIVRGESYFLPAALGAYQIEGTCRVLLSRI